MAGSTDLFALAQTLNSFRAFLGFAHRRQEHAGENGDHCNDNEQFNQGKAWIDGSCYWRGDRCGWDHSIPNDLATCGPCIDKANRLRLISESSWILIRLNRSRFNPAYRTKGDSVCHKRNVCRGHPADD